MLLEGSRTPLKIFLAVEHEDHKLEDKEADIANKQNRDKNLGNKGQPISVTKHQFLSPSA
jgi:hypothetical protein